MIACTSSHQLLALLADKRRPATRVKGRTDLIREQKIMSQPFILNERRGFAVVAAALVMTLAMTAHALVRPAGSSAIEIAAGVSNQSPRAADLRGGLRLLEQPRWQLEFFKFDDNARGVAVQLQRRPFVATV